MSRARDAAEIELAIEAAQTKRDNGGLGSADLAYLDGIEQALIWVLQRGTTPELSCLLSDFAAMREVEPLPAAQKRVAS